MSEVMEVIGKPVYLTDQEKELLKEMIAKDSDVAITEATRRGSIKLEIFEKIGGFTNG